MKIAKIIGAGFGPHSLREDRSLSDANRERADPGNPERHSGRSGHCWTRLTAIFPRGAGAVPGIQYA